MTDDSAPSIRTLRLKVKSEAYAWLNAAAVEVNLAWNFANETSHKAAHPFSGPPRYLSAFDLDKVAPLARLGAVQIRTAATQGQMPAVLGQSDSSV